MITITLGCISFICLTIAYYSYKKYRKEDKIILAAENPVVKITPPGVKNLPKVGKPPYTNLNNTVKKDSSISKGTCPVCIECGTITIDAGRGYLHLTSGLPDSPIDQFICPKCGNTCRVITTMNFNKNSTNSSNLFCFWINPADKIKRVRQVGLCAIKEIGKA